MKVLILIFVFCSTPIFPQEYLLRNPELGSTSDEIFYKLGRTYDLLDVRGDVKSLFQAWFSLNLEGTIVDFIISPINQHFFQEIAKLMDTPNVYLKYNISKYIAFTEIDDHNIEWEIKYYFYDDEDIFRLFLISKNHINRREDPEIWIRTTAQLLTNYLQIDTEISEISILPTTHGRQLYPRVCSFNDMENLYLLTTLLENRCLYIISKQHWYKYVSIFDNSE